MCLYPVPSFNIGQWREISFYHSSLKVAQRSSFFKFHILILDRIDISVHSHREGQSAIGPHALEPSYDLGPQGLVTRAPHEARTALI